MSIESYFCPIAGIVVDFHQESKLEGGAEYVVPNRCMSCKVRVPPHLMENDQMLHVLVDGDHVKSCSVSDGRIDS